MTPVLVIGAVVAALLVLVGVCAAKAGLDRTEDL